jgi:protein-tyrosine phosphatase
MFLGAHREECVTNNLALARRIAIEGCYNLRDVGGYPTRDGRMTRWRRLLRSDSLHQIGPEGQQALLDLGLRTIIDLRRPSEAQRSPNVFERSGRVRYISLPLFDDALGKLVDEPAADLDEMYRLYIDHCQAGFRAALGALASAGAAPVLIHCAVGKDRTGLTVALALGAAGVPAEAIADDYALSSAYLAPLRDSFRAYVRERGGDLDRLERMLLSRRETMLDTLAYIDDRYGGVPGYLEQIGVSTTEMAGLRQLLVEM